MTTKIQQPKLKRRALLRRYTQTMHEKLRPYQCEKCPYAALISAHFRQHVRAKHEKVRPYKCDICPYATSLKGNLNTHIRGIHKKGETIQM